MAQETKVIKSIKFGKDIADVYALIHDRTKPKGGVK